MQFKDYDSAFDQFRRETKCVRGMKTAEKLFRDKGIDPDSYASVYRAEVKRAAAANEGFATRRLMSELQWYIDRRPYFNIHPYIEKKLMNVDFSIDMTELRLPFASMEVRTKTDTFLVAHMQNTFFVVIELKGGYQEFLFSCNHKIQSVVDGKYVQADEASVFTNVDGLAATEEQRRMAIVLTAGVCLLSGDQSIVKPVILESDREKELTPSELEKYRNRAIARTGKTGFNVGEEMENSSKHSHYRNGCFAKYYVCRDHAKYPKNSSAHKAAIIQWRHGAIVNKDTEVLIPTGFKDLVT